MWYKRRQCVASLGLGVRKRIYRDSGKPGKAKKKKKRLKTQAKRLGS